MEQHEPTLWIATAADVDEEGSWYQLVTYDPADVVRFITSHPEAHVAEWLLDGDDEWDMVGP